jgi:hypothetical protein
MDDNRDIVAHKQRIDAVRPVDSIVAAVQMELGSEGDEHRVCGGVPPNAGHVKWRRDLLRDAMHRQRAARDVTLSRLLNRRAGERQIRIFGNVEEIRRSEVLVSIRDARVYARAKSVNFPSTSDIPPRIGTRNAIVEWFVSNFWM